MLCLSTDTITALGSKPNWLKRPATRIPGGTNLTKGVLSPVLPTVTPRMRNTVLCSMSSAQAWSAIIMRPWVRSRNAASLTAARSSG